MSRTCKKCGSVEYGIWGYIGVIGFSLLIGAMGYSLALIFNYPRLVIVACIFGIILMLPLWLISYHEEREAKKEELKHAERKRMV